MKKIILLAIHLLMLLFTSCSIPIILVQNNNAKKGTDLKIVMKNNDTIRGSYAIPNLNAQEVKIRTDDGQIHIYKSEDISYIEAWNKKLTYDNRIVFIYTLTKEYVKPKDQNDDRTKTLGASELPKWLLLVAGNEKIQILEESAGESYRLQGNGILVSLDPRNMYFRKNSDDFAIKASSSKIFKQIANRYFRECPPLIEKINSEEVYIYNHNDVVREYSICIK